MDTGTVWTIIIGIAVAFCIFMAVRAMLKDHKKGGCSACSSGGCSGCTTCAGHDTNDVTK